MSRRLPINVTLSVDGIAEALRAIDDYKAWLERKMNELRERVAEYIRTEAADEFGFAVVDDTFAVQVTDSSGKSTFEADAPIIGGRVTVTVSAASDTVTLVVANGEDAVWMEFGAGVYYNGTAGSSPHPRASVFGYTIGGYGSGKGKRNVWAFEGEDGAIHLTHGTPASMPMYKAMMKAWGDIHDIARAVFSS